MPPRLVAFRPSGMEKALRNPGCRCHVENGRALRNGGACVFLAGERVDPRIGLNRPVRAVQGGREIFLFALHRADGFFPAMRRAAFRDRPSLVGRRHCRLPGPRASPQSTRAPLPFRSLKGLPEPASPVRPDDASASAGGAALPGRFRAVAVLPEAECVKDGEGTPRRIADLSSRMMATGRWGTATQCRGLCGDFGGRCEKVLRNGWVRNGQGWDARVQSWI